VEDLTTTAGRDRGIVTFGARATKDDGALALRVRVETLIAGDPRAPPPPADGSHRF
jgi:hypothetical protein